MDRHEHGPHESAGVRGAIARLCLYCYRRGCGTKKLEQIGRWHDAEVRDTRRHIMPLRPHDLRHTFGFHLAQATGADAYELERRLGHRSQRYIQRYTNPPEHIVAAYIEPFSRNAMPSIHETAYPRLKRAPTPDELARVYTPTRAGNSSLRSR